MWKRVLWLLVPALVAACNKVGTPPDVLLLATPQRTTGIGDLGQPRFAGTGGPYLTVTDSGSPKLVFVVDALTLGVEAVSFRTPPPLGETTTAIEEIVRNAFALPDDDSSGGSVDGTKGAAAFVSEASDLLDPGTAVFFVRDSPQAFARDVVSGENVLVSMAPNGEPANDDVTSAAMSGGGRFVAFATRATNLVEPLNPQLAPNGASQIYVRDLVTGLIYLISQTSGDAPGAGDSTDPAITPDGRFVVFVSAAENLVVGDANMAADIFVYDRSKQTMTLIPGAFTAPAEPVISQNGRFVAFTAGGGGAREVFLFDASTGAVTPITPGADGDCASPSITPDGQFVAFESVATNLVVGDTEGFSDVFVWNGTTTARASVVPGDPATGGDGPSFQPTLSADGNFIAYVSSATNVAAPDPARPESQPNGLLALIVAVQPFGNP